jgi:hypothetical protein
MDRQPLPAATERRLAPIEHAIAVDSKDAPLCDRCGTLLDPSQGRRRTQRQTDGNAYTFANDPPVGTKEHLVPLKEGRSRTFSQAGNASGVSEASEDA